MHECTIPIRMNSHGPTAHQRSEGEVGNRISPTAPPSTTVSALRPRPPPQLPAKRGTRRGSRHPIYQTPRRWRWRLRWAKRPNPRVLACDVGYSAPHVGPPPPTWAWGHPNRTHHHAHAATNGVEAGPARQRGADRARFSEGVVSGSRHRDSPPRTYGSPAPLDDNGPGSSS